MSEDATTQQDEAASDAPAPPAGGPDKNVYYGVGALGAFGALMGLKALPGALNMLSAGVFGAALLTLLNFVVGVGGNGGLLFFVKKGLDGDAEAPKMIFKIAGGLAAATVVLGVLSGLYTAMQMSGGGIFSALTGSATATLWGLIPVGVVLYLFRDHR